MVRANIEDAGKVVGRLLVRSGMFEHHGIKELSHHGSRHDDVES
jgi:hypothetical protein